MSFLHSLIINDCEVKFSANENKTFCTSLDIARVFGKGSVTTNG
ncbi:hypothetical protein [Campylobacter upsaliensis]|nr:hypothetical protein [Campylobacter upsaliensis]